MEHIVNLICAWSYGIASTPVFVEAFLQCVFLPFFNSWGPLALSLGKKHLVLEVFVCPRWITSITPKCFLRFVFRF